MPDEPEATDATGGASRAARQPPGPAIGDPVALAAFAKFYREAVPG